jgi:glyoxylase-like metal-dependent hydrolase (beta-lactamase superfamily II)
MVDHIKTIDTMMFNKPKLTASYLIGTKNEFALIETGPSTSSRVVLNRLNQIPNFSPEKLKYIITTHIHLDHSGGAGDLVNVFPNAKIVHHPRTTRHLEDPTRLWESSVQTNKWTADMYGRPSEINSELIIPAKIGELFKIEDTELEIVDAPGHHSYHYSILDRNSNTLFVGDSCGWYWQQNDIIFPTTPPPRYNHQQYKETIKKHIQSNPSNIAFTHFDIVTDNVIEMLYNSLDITEMWFGLIKDYRKENNSITVKEAVNKLIEEKHPKFKDLEVGLKGAIFEIPVLGMFHYLDQLEMDPTKIK